MNNINEQEFQSRFDIELWKRMLKLVLPYKKYMIMLCFVMIGVGGIDVIFPLMTKHAIDSFVTTNSLEGLKPFIIKYIILIIVQTVNVWLLIAIAGKVDMGICYDIRKSGFKRLQELSFSYYDKTPIGWIMARLTSDTSRLGDTIAWGLVDFVWGFTMMFGIAGVMFFINAKLAAIALCVVPILIVISVFFQKRMLKAYRLVRKTNSKITGAFNEGIMGAKTTKTLVTEKKNLSEFKEITGEMYNSSMRAAIYSSIYLPIVLALGSIGTALALWMGGRGVYLSSISYGTLVLFLSYTIQFFEPVRELARVFSELLVAQASAERVLSLINTEPEIIDYIKDEKSAYPPIKGNISFCDVSFSYKDGEKVLEGFNLDVKAGETIALVGETGSGKSTIVNLLCRFYEPVGGKILIDGVDYRERTQHWLQSNLGYVLQSPHLFSGTIKENIRYGRLDAKDSEIVEAAKLVNADNFISKLEAGYDTQVGEGGGRLSTGEKQLISFARAVLANPRIFVLDEATSSIDTETEKIIQDAIQKVLSGRTSFIIAHRLSTIKSADRILVIKEGKILEQGSHSILMKKKGYYYKLYSNQFMEQKENELLNAQYV